MTLKSILAALLFATAASSAALSSTASAQQQRSPLAQIGDVLQPSSTQIPAESELVRLVDETMDIFIEGMKAKTMDRLHDHASSIVKREVTPARLNEIFKAFFAVPVTGRPLQSLAPVFSKAPEQLNSTVFKLVGYYPTQPQNVTFEISYIREGLSWKWVALNVRTVPAQPVGAKSGS